MITVLSAIQRHGQNFPLGSKGGDKIDIAYRRSALEIRPMHGSRVPEHEDHSIFEKNCFFSDPEPD